MQTAMKKLIEEILYHLAYDDDLTEESRNTLEKVVDKCKGKLEMEKQQIIDAYYQCGRDNFEHIKIINRSAIEYYSETYGSKGSDDPASDDYVDQLLEQEQRSLDKHTVSELRDKSSQTEISDEEIEEVAPYVPRDAHDYYVGHKDGFIEGAKWYREQLKQRQ